MADIRVAPTPNSHAKTDVDSTRLARLAAGLVRDRSASKRALRRRWLVWSLVIVLAIAGYVAWRMLRPVPVQTTIVTYQRVGPAARPILRQSGYVTYPRIVTVATTARTPVTALHFSEGQLVKKGAVLARFENSELVAQEQAQTVVLRDAQATLDRTRRLHEAGAASDAVLQQAQAAVDQADASLNLTRTQLAHTILRAPLAGLVTEKRVEVGEVATQGVCTLVDVSRTLIEVDVNQADIGKISPAQPAVVTLDAYPEVEYAAHVSTVSPAADQAKNTVQVKIEVLHPDGRFKPQLSAKVFFVNEALPENQPVHAVLAVDTSALVQEGGQVYAWVLEDGRAVRRALQLGQDLGEVAEVLGGLRENEQVITNAARRSLRQKERVVAQ